VAASTYAYCQISLDKGATWKGFEVSEKSAYVHSITIVGTTIFMGVDQGLLYSETNGESWKKASGIKGAHIISITKNGTTLYAGGRNTDKYGPVMYISTDGGAKWSKSIEGLGESGEPVTSIAINGTTVLATAKCNNSYGVFAYDATGKKWNMLNNADQFTKTPVRKIAISDTSYLVSTNNDYFISSDKGITWKTIKTEYPDGTFYNGNQLINGTGVIYTATYSGSLFTSKDNGASWTKCKWQADAEKATADAALLEKNKNDAVLAKQQRYRDSVAVVTEFRQKNDKTLKNYFKGIAEMSYSNFDTALVRFNAAITAKPDFTAAFEARIKCHQEMKQPENAKKDSIILAGIMAEGKVGSEMYTECYYKDAYGWYLRAQNDYSSENKSNYLWKAIELDTTKAEYYIALGDVSRDRSYDVAADVHYNRAMKLNPKCEWYDYDMSRMLTCGNCNGKGYRLQINITQQKVNNTTQSSSDSERVPCTECYQGYVKTIVKYRCVRLTK
jgi:photosystem II stability/assembly factor-like uncharacterized protein